jgi:hypothetical protein
MHSSEVVILLPGSVRLLMRTVPRLASAGLTPAPQRRKGVCVSCVAMVGVAGQIGTQLTLEPVRGWY